MKRGFSLIELLLVLAIMSIVLAFGSWVTVSVQQASLLSRDSSVLADELARASLESIKLNQPVQFRLYRFRDTLTSSKPLIQAFQTLTMDSKTGKYIQHGNIRFLSRSIYIHENPEASTILNLPERNPVPEANTGMVTDPELATIQPYTYYGFEFRPDGSTNLPKDKTWGLILAIYNENHPKIIPDNYRALGINPFTGSIVRY